MPDFRRRLALVWVVAGKMGLGRRKRVREKLDRFLASGHILPARTFRFTAPGHLRAKIGVVRQTFWKQLVAALPHEPTEILQYVWRHLRFSVGGPTYMDQRFADHYRLAEAITWEMFDDVDEATRTKWESRQDIVWMPYNFRLPSQIQKSWLAQWAAETAAMWIQQMARGGLVAASA
jgi:hypothetical protein